VQYLAFSIFSLFEIILIICLAGLIRWVCESNEVDITLIDSYISAGILSLVYDRCWTEAKKKAAEAKCQNSQ